MHQYDRVYKKVVAEYAKKTAREKRSLIKSDNKVTEVHKRGADPFCERLICERIEREESAMPLIGAVADDLTGNNDRRIISEIESKNSSIF